MGTMMSSDMPFEMRTAWKLNRLILIATIDLSSMGTMMSSDVPFEVRTAWKLDRLSNILKMTQIVSKAADSIFLRSNCIALAQIRIWNLKVSTLDGDTGHSKKRVD